MGVETANVPIGFQGATQTQRSGKDLAKQILFQPPSTRSFFTPAASCSVSKSIFIPLSWASSTKSSKLCNRNMSFHPAMTWKCGATPLRKPSKWNCLSRPSVQKEFAALLEVLRCNGNSRRNPLKSGDLSIWYGKSWSFCHPCSIPSHSERMSGFLLWWCFFFLLGGGHFFGTPSKSLPKV